jgi:zinc protease
MMAWVRKTGPYLLLMACVVPAVAEAAALGSRAEMPSGLALLVAERPSIPIVTVQIMVKAGSVQEPTDKAGVAKVTAVLLPLGTVNRTAPEISEAIEFVGGSLDADASEDYSTLFLTVLKKDLAVGMELLADVLLRPAFRDADIARKIRELKGHIRQKQEDPGTVAREAFMAAVFGGHPYGRPMEGSEATLDRITREDLLEFHRRYYRPNNSIMTVAGDVTLEEFRRHLDRYFAGWEPMVIPRPDPGPATPHPARQAVKIERGVTQANIVWGHLGIARTNPDFYAVSVMNQVLGGGGLTARLMRAIREERGWAYDVQSYFSARTRPGPFVVALQTKNETATAAVEEVMRQIQRIRVDGVTPEELEEAKGYLTGSFPLRIDTNRDLVSLLAAVEFYGLGMDYAEQYPALIRAVTRDDILRVARTYLHPDQGILVVVADLEKARLPF